jgi:ferredoxin
MNTKDGKSDLLGAKWKGKQFVVTQIDESEREDNEKAAKACPVKIIRLEE